jgi:hypothetical protein
VYPDCLKHTRPYDNLSNTIAIMHDLRRQALGGGKTVSRKAASRTSASNSKAVSRANSRVGSRAVSRAGSEEEVDDEFSDGTDLSVASLDQKLDEEEEKEASVWKAELAELLEEVLDRKRSSTESREATYTNYIRTLMSHYVVEDIDGKEMDLVAAFIKSLKNEDSEKETILATKAVSITLITSPLETIYEAVVPQLKRTITDSVSMTVKAAAIQCLGVCTFYGGVSDEEVLEEMSYLLEIITSDGAFIEAADEAGPVLAAIEQWGFLATQIDDFSEISEEAVEAFVEQLDAADVSVQIAAGEAIALIYSKSYTEQEEDEEVEENIDEEDHNPNGTRWIKRYEAYRRTDQLIHQLQGLTKLSTRSVSKKDRKNLHTSFADILNSVEHPTLGPRYSQALDQDGNPLGSRMTVRLYDSGVMCIDQWWKLHVLQGLRRVLQSGFMTHYERNSVVLDSLPVLIKADLAYKKKPHGRTAKVDRRMLEVPSYGNTY